MKIQNKHLVALLIAGTGFLPVLPGSENSAAPVHVSVKHTGDVEMKPKMEIVTYLGVEVREVDPVLLDHLDLDEGIGLVVEMVKADSPAERAGLRENDILVRMGDQLLITPRQLGVLIRREDDGERVSLEILRKGKRSKVQVTLEEREVPVRSGFRWFGGGPMPQMDFPFPKPDARHIERIIRKEINTSHPPRVPGESHRIIHIDPHRNMVYTSDEGTVEMVIGGETSSLVVTDPDGGIVYEGSADAEVLPDAVRERIEALDVELRVDLEDLPEPPQVELRRIDHEPTI